jgi:hypothetical protein
VRPARNGWRTASFSNRTRVFGARHFSPALHRKPFLGPRHDASLPCQETADAQSSLEKMLVVVGRDADCRQAEVADECGLSLFDGHARSDQCPRKTILGRPHLSPCPSVKFAIYSGCCCGSLHPCPPLFSLGRAGITTKNLASSTFASPSETLVSRQSKIVHFM